MNAHFQLALESLQGWGLEVCFKNSKAIILWKYRYGTLINVFQCPSVSVTSRA